MSKAQIILFHDMKHLENGVYLENDVIYYQNETDYE